jgi:hypothetical protein
VVEDSDPEAGRAGDADAEAEVLFAADGEAEVLFAAEGEDDGEGEGEGDCDGEGDSDGDGEGDALALACAGSAWQAESVAFVDPSVAACAAPATARVRKLPLSTVAATTLTCPKRIRTPVYADLSRLPCAACDSCRS